MSVLLCLAIFARLVPFSSEITLGKKNVCRNWWGYNIGMERNSDCWYNPDLTMSTPELIEKYTGGKSETYDVITEDGYILRIYRFPPPRRNPPKGAVLMRHPALFGARLWVIQGNTSTAVLIWRDGWDVWLSSGRGTEDSERHINMSSGQSKFWDFTFDDMGKYDVSAEVKLMRSKNGNAKIYFMGHSLGSITALSHAANCPEEARDGIEVMILASTPCYFTTNSPFYLIYILDEFLETLLSKTLDLGAWIPILPTVKQVARLIFRLFPPITYLVNIGWSVLMGWALTETDPEFINLDFMLNIDNGGWKTAWHGMQFVRKRDACGWYDYGPAENMRRYGTSKSPAYPVWNFTVPVLLVSSSSDTLTHQKDSDLLYSRLSPTAKKYGYLHINRLNHMDYHSGKHRIELYINNVIRLLNNIQSRRR